MKKKKPSRETIKSSYERAIAFAKKTGVNDILMEVMEYFKECQNDWKGISTNQIELTITIILTVLKKLDLIKRYFEPIEYKNCSKCKKNKGCYDAEHKYKGGCFEYEDE